MLKALHGIGLMISQSWLCMECTAMTCVTGIHAFHLRSWYVWTVALLTLCYLQVDHTSFPSSYDVDKLSWNSTVCYTCWTSVALCGHTLKLKHQNHHKRMEFCAFVFVSLVYIHLVTTEKQHIQCENSEFCCCCQEGTIRNIYCWGSNQGTVEVHLKMELSCSCTT
jgi:hypothetical protein